MQIIYEKYRDRQITYPDGVTGYIAGYVENNLLLATKDDPDYCFRKFDKKWHYVDEAYKSSEWRYTYCSEGTAEKQHPTCAQKNL